MVAELVEDADLQKEPAEGAPAHGLLPKGTLLRLLGDQQGKFIHVEVELEQGSLEGWVRQDRLNLDEQDKEKAKEKPKKRIREIPFDADQAKPTRARVPKDESLLLGRKPSFFYGVGASGNYGLIRSPEDGRFYAGPGFSAGANVGMYVDRSLPIRFEMLYTTLTGASSDGFVAGWGFVQAGFSGAYNIDNIEIFGSMHYAFGISISDLPTDGPLFNSPSDMSSLWFGGGVGYRIPLSPLTSLTSRAFYSISFSQAPFNFQILGVMFLIDLQG